VTVHHREQLDAVQRQLRETQGCSVLVMIRPVPQKSAGGASVALIPDRRSGYFINELVCEVAATAASVELLSVVPVETEFGRKRAIDQSTCNKDFSCVNGFCPSFVTVEGGGLRRRKSVLQEVLAELPVPSLPVLDKPYGILVTGIGGTGVVTIGALLGMAAHLEGKGVAVLE